MSDIATAAEVVTFWWEAGAEAWYKQSDTLDQTIRDRFGGAWQAAHDGTLPEWAVDADGALGLIILLDQFSRNMFRNDPRAFATDAKAYAVADKMRAEGWDLQIDEPMRQFAYMPYMHAEDMAHQDLAVELMETRMTDGNNDLHAHAHREIIRRFGRFPFRNGALGRETTAEEQAFLDGGAYGSVVRELEAQAKD